jgi:hypothetical protein
MIMTNKEYNSMSIFSTDDSALAAWLHINDIELLEVRKDTFPSLFIFRNSENIIKLKEEFRSGNATGNIIAYDRARQIMVAKARGK